MQCNYNSTKFHGHDRIHIQRIEEWFIPTASYCIASTVIRLANAVRDLLPWKHSGRQSSNPYADRTGAATRHRILEKQAKR
jgi:hypothetical protein